LQVPPSRLLSDVLFIHQAVAFRMEIGRACCGRYEISLSTRLLIPGFTGPFAERVIVGQLGGSDFECDVTG
jgi:hypothetical protein